MRARTSALVVVAAAMWLACAPPPRSATQSGRALTRSSARVYPEQTPPTSHPIPWDTRIVLQRERCHLRKDVCARYELEIFSNGDVLYRGQGAVALRGQAAGRVLSMEELAQLAHHLNVRRWLGHALKIADCYDDCRDKVDLLIEMRGRRSQFRLHRHRPDYNDRVLQMANRVEKLARARSWLGQLEIEPVDSFAREAE